MAIPLATAFVRLRPDPDRSAFRREGEKMGDEAGSAAGQAFGDGFSRDAQGRWRAANGRFASDAEKVANGLEDTGQRGGRRFGKGLAKGFDTSTFQRVVATAAARFTLFGAAAAAATPGVIHLTAALLPAAGAVAGLPVAMAGFAAAAGTFKVATAGVGDAITKGLTGTAKQAEKAMKDLPPAARTFAGSIVALKKPINDLRASVAQRFFAPLQNEVKPLAQLYLPLLRARMSELAGPLGGLGEQFAQTARKTVVWAGVSDVFQATRLAVVNLRGAINPLGVALGNVLSSTAELLPGMADGFVNVTRKVSAWVTEAAKSGQLVTLWQNAMTTLRDLAGIAGNVGSILRSVFSAATSGGTSLLGNLRALTGQAADFLKTAEGAGALRAVFTTLASLGTALRSSLGAVLPAIAQSIGTLGPVIAQLATAAARFIVALAPLLPLVARIAAQVATALVPILSALAGWVERNQGLIMAMAPTVIGLAAGFKAVSFATGPLLTVVGKLFLLLRANPIGLVITAIALMVTWTIHLWKTNEDFRRQVLAVWGAIKVGIGAVANWFTGTIAPSIARAIQQGQALWRGLQAVVGAVWNAIRSYIMIQWSIVRGVFLAIRAGLTIVATAFRTFAQVAGIVWRTFGAGVRAIWTSIRTGSFTPLRDFITKTLPGAFRTGVDAIRAAWAKVQAAARVPVAFVVNHVVNPLIGGYNAIARVFGAPQASKIPGFASGGRIPGSPSTRDNRLASVVDTGNMIKVATGEWITDTRSTMANLPILQAMKRNPGKRLGINDLDPYLDGAARGGRVQGDGIGDFLGKVWNGIKGAASFVTNPVAGLKKLYNSVINRVPGAGMAVGLLKGMAGKVLGGVTKLLTDFGGGIGGGGIGGGWQRLVAIAKAFMPNIGVLSTFRPGARTLSGNRSYHSMGRAVDFSPVRALAQMFYSRYGKNLKELITPWRSLNLLNGRPHRYSPAIERQHGVGSAGNDHIHVAAALGGLVTRLSGITERLASAMPVKLFDSGGAWPSGTLGANLSGRTEWVSTSRAGGGGVLHLHVHNHGVIGSQAEMDRWLETGVKRLKERRRI